MTQANTQMELLYNMSEAEPVARCLCHGPQHGQEDSSHGRQCTLADLVLCWSQGDVHVLAAINLHYMYINVHYTMSYIALFSGFQCCMQSGDEATHTCTYIHVTTFVFLYSILDPWLNY